MEALSCMRVFAWGASVSCILSSHGCSAVVPSAPVPEKACRHAGDRLLWSLPDGLPPRPVRTEDALRQLGSERYDIVATNPPFGRKSSLKVIGEDGQIDADEISYDRDDLSGLPPPTSSSIFCSTSARCSRSTVAPPRSLTTGAAPSGRWKRSWRIWCCRVEPFRPDPGAACTCRWSHQCPIRSSLWSP